MLVNREKRKMYGIESICRMTDLFFDEGQTGGGGAPLSMPPLLERGGVEQSETEGIRRSVFDKVN